MAERPTAALELDAIEISERKMRATLQEALLCA